MPGVHIVPVLPSRHSAAVEALTAMFCRAFDDDAHINWFVRQDAQRQAALARFFRLLLTEIAGGGGEIVATTDLRGAAVWFQPGAGKLPLPTQARVALRFAAITGWHNLPVRAYGLNRMERRRPKVPHYYLQTLAVDPAAQGLGYGSALLESLWHRCRGAGAAAYLETSKQGNTVFYGKHGFRIIGSARLPRGPLLYQMLRSER